MKNFFELMLVLSALGCLILAECIPACLLCFFLCVVFAAILYGLEMRDDA